MNLPLIGNHTGDGSGDDGAMEAKDLRRHGRCIGQAAHDAPP